MRFATDFPGPVVINHIRPLYIFALIKASK